MRPGSAPPKRRPSWGEVEKLVREGQQRALMEAADAWDAMSPQERHSFVKGYRSHLALATLPSTWLRVRAYRG